MEVSPQAVLPPEILIDVLAFLDITALKAFRQCNKLLSKEAARLLFHTLIVFLQRSSFEHLRNIADHDDIRLHVRRICYVGSRYHQVSSIEEWRYYYGRSLGYPLNAVVWLQKPYAAYKQLADEQKRIVSNGRESEAWLYGLERLPNLTGFHISLQEARKPNRGLLHPIMSRTFVEPDVYADNTYEVPILPFLERLEDPLYPKSMPRNSLPTIHTLHLEGLDIRCFLSLVVFPGTGLKYLRGVRHLRLDIASTKGLSNSFKTELSCLRTTLIRSLGLIKLHVSCLKPAWELSLNHMFGDKHVWPDLAQVELVGVDSKAEDLAGFIGRHGKSLRQLVLRDSCGDLAADGFNAALLRGTQLLECDPSGSLSSALASAAIQWRVEDGCRSFTASWD